MANSTYISTVNRVLYHAGQQPIADNTTFNDNTLLEKPQLQAKLFVDKAHRRLIRTSRPRERKRLFTFNTADGDNDYTLDSTVTFENLVQDSWFITTSGVAKGPLKYITYDQMLEWFPAGQTSEGVPDYWFDYPNNGTNERFGFIPIPAGTYAVQYEGYLDVGALSSATDTIAFPVKFEDILWDHAQTWLEISMSEGKAQDMYAVLDGLFQEYRQLTQGPRDRPPQIRIGIKVQGPQKGRGRWVRDGY